VNEFDSGCIERNLGILLSLFDYELIPKFIFIVIVVDGVHWPWVFDFIRIHIVLWKLEFIFVSQAL
jgi:hypothetical protein